MREDPVDNGFGHLLFSQIGVQMINIRILVIHQVRNGRMIHRVVPVVHLNLVGIDLEALHAVF